MPECFLPGDGAPPAQPPASPAGHRLNVDVPLATVDFEDTREAVRAAEARLAKIRADEEALSQRRTECIAFQHQVEEFQLDIANTLQKLNRLEVELTDGSTESNRCAAAIHRSIQTLQIQLAKIEQMRIDDLSKSRIQSELDHALALLADVEQTTRSEISRLAEELPRRMKPVRNGLIGRVLYGMGSALAFLLPLIAFIAVAVILLLTALGLV